MNALNFTEEDKAKVVAFLNMVAEHAEFKVNTNELIEYFKLVAYMQKELIPKVDANILEVKRVVESEESSEDE